MHQWDCSELRSQKWLHMLIDDVRLHQVLLCWHEFLINGWTGYRDSFQWSERARVSGQVRRVVSGFAMVTAENDSPLDDVQLVNTVSESISILIKTSGMHLTCHI